MRFQREGGAKWTHSWSVNAIRRGVGRATGFNSNNSWHTAGRYRVLAAVARFHFFLSGMVWEFAVGTGSLRCIGESFAEENMNAQSIIPGVGRLHSLSRTPASTAFVPILPASLLCLVTLLATAFTARPAQAAPFLLVGSIANNSGTVGKYDAVTGAAINVPFFSPPQMGSHEMVFDQHNHLFVSGSGTVGLNTTRPPGDDPSNAKHSTLIRAPISLRRALALEASAITITCSLATPPPRTSSANTTPRPERRSMPASFIC